MEIPKTFSVLRELETSHEIVPPGYCAERKSGQLFSSGRNGSPVCGAEKKGQYFHQCLQRRKVSSKSSGTQTKPKRKWSRRWKGRQAHVRDEIRAASNTILTKTRAKHYIQFFPKIPVGFKKGNAKQDLHVIAGNHQQTHITNPTAAAHGATSAYFCTVKAGDDTNQRIGNETIVIHLEQGSELNSVLRDSQGSTFSKRSFFYSKIMDGHQHRNISVCDTVEMRRETLPHNRFSLDFNQSVFQNDRIRRSRLAKICANSALTTVKNHELQHGNCMRECTRSAGRAKTKRILS